MKSIYYFAFPDYLGLRPLVEKNILYFCILDRSLPSHQFCFETGLTSIPYLLLFRRSWSSIRNLLLTRKNIFEEYVQSQINSKHFGYTVTKGQRQFLSSLRKMSKILSNDLVKS